MRRYSMRKILLSAVWVLHSLFLLLLFLQPHFTPKPKEHKTLIVKTIIPKPPPSIAPRSVTQIAAHSPAKKASPPAAAQKKEPAKPPAPTKKAPAKKPAPPAPAEKKEPAIADKKLGKEKKSPTPQKKPESRAKISDSLLKELEESIAKIDKKPSAASIKTAKTTPLMLQIDSESVDTMSAEESSYADLLVGHLRQTLSLPDYGEVKIQLSLRQDGSVAKISVLRAQSKENKRYLEELLPYMRFPRFEGSFARQKEASFILTFVNEI